MRLFLGFLLSCALLLGAHSASAQSSGFIEIRNNSKWNVDHAGSVIGQVIRAPSFDRWDRVELVMEPTYSGSQIRPMIYEWDNDLMRVKGSALWQGPVKEYSEEGYGLPRDYALNLPIVPDGYYFVGMEVVLGDGVVSAWFGDDHPHGNLHYGPGISDLTERSDYDMKLKAYFSNTPAIPTLSEWAMILFGGLVALVGAGLVWRSRPLGQGD